MTRVIGIDIGGTAIKLGLFASDGSCDRSLTLPTPQPATPTAVLEAMVEAIAPLVSASGNIKAIGVGLPGPTDATGRVSTVAINLSNWQNVPLADWLEEKTGLPAILANDANCAALGESWQGAGRCVDNLIKLTSNIGVGGAAISTAGCLQALMGRGGIGASLL